MTLDLKGAQKVLTESTELLTSSLDPREILRKMKSRNALTEDEVTRINIGETITEKVDKLLETLRRKPLTSYQVFMQLLKEDRPDLYTDVKDKEENHIGKPSLKIFQHWPGRPTKMTK